MFRFAVIGNPVSHSKSPQIHSMFARQSGIELDYSAIEVPLGGFQRFVAEFFQAGGTGLNITVPFKEVAFRTARSCTQRARQARAVNTMYVDASHTLCGDNTDGIGLVTDLQGNHHVELKGCRILLLGAGGAVRGVLGEIIKQEPAQITLLNRTRAKAESIRDDYKSSFEIEVGSYDNPPTATFDLIINGTSMGLTGEVPHISATLLGKACCCYDMVYGPRDTPFVTWAKQQGVDLALDGLGMLVEQAAEAFAIWHGIKPDTAPVIEALRRPI